MGNQRHLDLVESLLDQTRDVLAHSVNPTAAMIAAQLENCAECGRRCPGITHCYADQDGPPKQQQEKYSGAEECVGHTQVEGSSVPHLSSSPHMNASLLALRKLPSFSPVVAKLMMDLSRGETNLQEQAELIASDAGFSAELLRLANSASVGHRSPVTRTFDALSLVGINRVASLAATLCVSRLVKTISSSRAMQQCWRHNLATALLARDWAKSFAIDPDEGYMYGLLAGLGRLALLASQPSLYAQLVERSLTEGIALDVLEAQEFGIDSNQAGTWLVVEWQLPIELLAVFAPTSQSRLGTLICEAGKEAARLGLGMPAVEPCDPKDPASLHIAERVHELEQALGL